MAASPGGVWDYISRVHPFGIAYTVLGEGAAAKGRPGDASLPGLEVRLRLEYTAAARPSSPWTEAPT
ncbi:MAG: hypothetical protein HPY75_03265 [Actinobacteria bacterium]|nr:hypothetical protein [Actinomycetota bacterium]